MTPIVIVLTIAACITAIGFFVIAWCIIFLFIEYQKDKNTEPSRQKEKEIEKKYISHKNWANIPENVKEKITSGSLSNQQISEILLMPWDSYISTQENYEQIDMNHVLASLTKSHYGMLSAKKEITLYLISKKYTSLSSLYLLLNGPPGTGKSTLAIAVAEAIGRKPIVINLNGMYSSAAITGSESWFIGASSGAITKAIIEAGVFNPLIILDEIDKCATSTHNGNVWDSLLQIFDITRRNFKDTYLDIYYDISQVMFIATSNKIDNMPKSLLNRLQVVNVDGYSKMEKLEILHKHILPKLYNNYNQISDLIQITSDDINNIINDSIDDDGIRSISRLAESIFTNKLLKLNNLENYFLENTISENNSYKIDNTYNIVTNVNVSSKGRDWINWYYNLYYSSSIVHKNEAFSLFAKNLPERLYRYRSAKNKEYLINELNGYIYCGTRSEMNDPFDARSLIISENADDYFDMDSSLQGKKIKSFVNDDNIPTSVSYLLALNNMYDLFGKYIRYACFTEMNTNMPMWSHYSNNSFGMCIEYETKYINDMLVSKCIKPIQYVNKLFDGMKEIFPSLQHEDFEQSNLDDFKKWIEYHLLQKLEEWSYECEWRLIKWNQEINQFIPDENNESLPEGMLYLCKPTAIYLGANASLDSYNEIIEYCKKIKIDVYKINITQFGISIVNI